MNEVIHQIITWRSCKKFKPDMIPQEIIDQIVEAGLYAASGMGKQSPIILEVSDVETRNLLSRLNHKYDPQKRPDPFYGAPVALVVLAPTDVPTWLYDGSLVIGNMMLAAHALGIGSCWIHRAKETFEDEEGKALLARLGISGHYEGIGNCVIGYSDVELRDAPKRRDGRIFKIRKPL